MGDKKVSILKLAAIRRFVDKRLTEDFYIDVMEKIVLPSSDGNYVGYDAIVVVGNAREKEAIENIVFLLDAKIAVICL